MAITNNLGLRTWDRGEDPYVYQQLATNWELLDDHDHSPNRGLQIPEAGIKDEAVGSNKIKPFAVTETRLAAASVSVSKLANNSVATDKLQDYAVTNIKVADDAIQIRNLDSTIWDTVHGMSILSARPDALNENKGWLWFVTDLNGGTLTRSDGNNWDKISRGIDEPPTGPAGGALSGTYPNPQIAANAVGSGAIADAAVDTTELADGAVIAAKLADSAVTNSKLANDSVTSAKIATNAVGSSEIAADAVGTSELADASVARENIQDQAVDINKLNEFPAVHVRMDQAQVDATVITVSGENSLTWNSEQYDTVGMASLPSTDLVVPSGAGGYYSVDAGISITGSFYAPGQYIDLLIYRQWRAGEPWEVIAWDRKYHNYNNANTIRVRDPITYLEAGGRLTVHTRTNYAGQTGGFVMRFAEGYPYFTAQWINK